MTELTSLVKLDNATRMLAEIRTIDDAKQLIDLAEAARYYARQADLGLEAQNHAAEIKLRAQRRAGEILANLDKNEGGRPLENWLHPATSFIPTYDDLGIEKRDAHVWQTIATMPEHEFEEKLSDVQIAGLELSTAMLYREARQIIAKENKTDPPTIPGKFQVIYADPPWRYDNSGFYNSAESNYPTMAIEEIMNLSQIHEWTTDESVLFLWATNPLLIEALQVMAAWGFEYKTNIAWIKDRGRGFGWFLRSKHELLLIGVKPSTPKPIERPDSAQLFNRPSTHSKKPDGFYELIEKMYPGNKIELFGRERRPGWELWGNENV